MSDGIYLQMIKPRKPRIFVVLFDVLSVTGPLLRGSMSTIICDKNLFRGR